MKKLILKTRDEIKTMTDPYRLDIIQVFRDNDSETLTVKDIAKAMGEQHGKVYYHIKKLEKVEAVIVDHTEVINGITAKYYKLNFEEIHIERKGNGAQWDEVELSNTLNLIVRVFDESRDELIKYIRETDKLHNDEDCESMRFKHSATVTSSELFFTEESYKEFLDEIKATIDKYSQKKKGNDIFRKNFLSAIYGDVKDLKKLKEGIKKQSES